MFDLLGTTSRGETRGRIFRALLVLGGLAALIGAAGFLLGWPAVLRIWPYLGYGLTPLFLASILAAVGAPVIWIGISAEFAAIRGGAANLLLVGGGIAAYSMLQAWGDPAGRVQTFAAIHLAVGTLAVLLLVAAQHIPWRDMKATPVSVRIAFAIYGIVLIAVGVALVLGAEVFPWRLDHDTSVVYGVIFLGSAIYFVYGLARPVWGNAKGQLLGFLAYDLVLILPFIRLWFTSPSLSLAIYLAVIVSSAILGVWYLFVSPRYRLWAAE